MIKRRHIAALGLLIPLEQAAANATESAPYTRVRLDSQLLLADRLFDSPKPLLSRLSVPRAVYFGLGANRDQWPGFLMHVKSTAHEQNGVRVEISVFNALTTARLARTELITQSGQAAELEIPAEPGRPKLKLILTPRFVSSVHADDTMAQREFERELEAEKAAGAIKR